MTRYLFLLAALLPSMSRAQDGALAPTLLPGMGPDGQAYVYHTAGLLGGQGAVVERREAGSWRPLTTDPLRPLRDPAAFESALGEAYTWIAEGLGTESPAQTLSTLRGNRLSANLYAVLFPEAADALGRRAADPSARAGQTVRYRLRLVDRSGETAGQPIEVTHTYAARPIAPVADLTSELDGQTVRLRWTYPAGRQARDRVYGFRVVRLAADLAAAGDTLRGLAQRPLVRNDADRTYVAQFETDLELGQSETFEVVPVYLTGALGPARRVTVTLRDQEPPLGIQPLADAVEAPNPADDTITLRWERAAEPDAVGYHVYRRRSLDDDRGVRLTAEPLDVDQTTWTDTTARRGTYGYALGVLDASGNESERAQWASATLIDRLPPQPPAGLSPRLLPSGSVEATWQRSPSDDVERYLVWRQRDGLPGLNRLADDARTTRLVDTGVSGEGFREGARYRYAVAAVDSSGNVSDTLFAAVAIPDLTAPAAPDTLEVALSSSNQVVLSWPPSRSSDAVRYRVISMDAAPTDTLVDVTAFEGGYVPPDVTRELSYAVSALDAAGNESEPTRATLLVRDATAPRQVRGVSARREADAVVVTWEPVPGGVAGYRVLRAASAVGPFVAVASPDASQTRHRDPAGGDEAWYRVLAVDAAGNASRPAASVRAE